MLIYVCRPNRYQNANYLIFVATKYIFESLWRGKKFQKYNYIPTDTDRIRNKQTRTDADENGLRNRQS